MKVDFSRSFTDEQGNPVTVNGKTQVIGGQLCLTLFNLTHVHGSPATPEQKYTAYTLCRRIQADAASVELTTEEGTFLKDIASEAFSAGAYGQVVDIIENNN